MATTSGVGTLSSLGVGSGLDIQSIISGLMSVEQQPQKSLQTQQSAVQSKISAYGQISSALSALQTAINSISTASKFNQQTLTSGDPKVFTATSSGAASVSSYNIAVSQLAQSQKLSTGGFTNTTDVVGTGTLTFSFPGNTAKQNVSITIDSSNNTLTGVRDAINQSGASVTASIVNDGTTNRLVITSKDSGTMNAMKISLTDSDGNNTDGTGLSQLAYDPTGTKNLSELQQAKDAKINVDGIDIVKPSNTISDALDGITLNLLQTSPTTTASDGNGGTVTTFNKIPLNVTTDNTKVGDALKGFVDAYNKYMSTMKDLTKFDPSGVQQGKANTKNGPLLGDATVSTINSQLRNILISNVNTSGTTQASLSDVGISLQADGTLALDRTKLDKAINSNFSQVQALFTTTGSGTTAVKGIAAQLGDKLKDILSSSGIIQAKTDGYNKTVKGLTQKISDWDDRLTKIEARYRAQYTALDIQLANMKNTTNQVNQMVNQLNANSKG